jgi:hypothetical protein
VTTDDFVDLFTELNPQLETTKTAVSGAVLDLTGIKKTSSYREGRGYKGFHLPSADELLDPAHAPGLDVMSIQVPKRPCWKAARREIDFMLDFSLLPLTNHMRRALVRQYEHIRQHGHLPYSAYSLVSSYLAAS